jgi:pyruvate dehydrogenase E2 component (dihydrolipoamide acetyltransferase)
VVLESPSPSPAVAETETSDTKAPSSRPKSDPAGATPSSPSPSQPRETLTPGERLFASPVAKKLALERGVPLAKVKGTGPGGRIIREDVEGYQASAPTASSISGSSLPEYIEFPASNMRRTIATRLVQSKQDVPHYYLTMDIHVDKLLKLREVFNKAMEADADKAKGAIKFSVNDFIIKAVACALADVPEANSQWLGESTRQ